MQLIAKACLQILVTFVHCIMATIVNSVVKILLPSFITRTEVVRCSNKQLLISADEFAVC